MLSRLKDWQHGKQKRADPQNHYEHGQTTPNCPSLPAVPAATHWMLDGTASVLV
jgi:hypothetical protein